MPRTPRSFKPPVGHIRLENTEGSIRVDAMQGPEPPRIVSGGSGGWEVVPRPMRTGLTEWHGNEPYRQEVSLLLDGYSDDESVEPRIKALERLASADWGDGFQPPVLRGFGILHDELLWVVDTDGLTFGDSITSARTRDRIRQYLTVTLLQYVAADSVRIRPVQRARKNSAKPGTQKTSGIEIYTVTKADLAGGLRKISATLYGTPKRWAEIMKLNPPMRDPMDLKFGQKLRVRPS